MSEFDGPKKNQRANSATIQLPAEFWNNSVKRPHVTGEMSKVDQSRQN